MPLRERERERERERLLGYLGPYTNLRNKIIFKFEVKWRGTIQI